MSDIVPKTPLPTKYHDADDETKQLIKERAIQQRMVKVPLKVIARECGVTISTIHVWCAEYRKENMDDVFDPEDMRSYSALTIDILERNAFDMLSVLMKGTYDADTGRTEVDVDLVIKAQAHIAKLEEQKAKLLGLNAPQRVEHNVPIRGEYDAELEQWTAAFIAVKSGVGGQLVSRPDEVYTPDGS